MDDTNRETPDVESSTDNYATRFTGEIGEWFLHVQSNATYYCLADMDPGKVLDAGGGHGQNVRTVLSLHHQMYILGSKVSCKHRVQEKIDAREVHFELGYLTEMPYADSSFDVTISYRMLAHLNDWQTHIAELCRVSNNLVIVDFPTTRSVNYFSAIMFPMKKQLEKNTRPFALYKEQSIVKEFAKHGFLADKKIGQFFFPMALHRALKTVVLSKFLEGAARITGLSYIFGSPVVMSFQRNKT